MRWLGLGVGAVAGALAGIFFAPYPGRELRDRVRHGAAGMGQGVRGRAGRWIGLAAGRFHRLGNRLEQWEHAAVRGTTAVPRVRAVIHREEGISQR